MNSDRIYNNDHLIIIYGLYKGSNLSIKNANPSFSYPIDINAASVFTMLAAFYFFATCRHIYW